MVTNPHVPDQMILSGMRRDQEPVVVKLPAFKTVHVSVTIKLPAFKTVYVNVVVKQLAFKTFHVKLSYR